MMMMIHDHIVFRDAHQNHRHKQRHKQSLYFTVKNLPFTVYQQFRSSISSHRAIKEMQPIPKHKYINKNHPVLFHQKQRIRIGSLYPKEQIG